MKNKKKININNRRWSGEVLGRIWNGFVIFGTVTGVFYSAEFWRGKVYQSKKRIYDIYDDDVIDEVNALMKKSLYNQVDLDYDETLNKLQEIKNLAKIEKKDD